MAITGASLQPIYDRLHAVQGYHPMSADTFADWSVEAGDIVTMKRDNTPLATPIHNTKIVWRGSPQVTLNSTGNEERESISRVSRRKYGRGGGMTNDQRIYRDMWSEDGHLHSELEITESVLRTEYSAADSRLQSEFEITASHLRTEFTDADNHLQSEIEVTASHLRTEFTDADNHLQSEIEVTASHLRTEYTDADNALRGEIEVTASHLRADYEAADGRLEGELEMTASHLRTEFTDSDERLKSEFEITASHLQTEFQDADARLASEMEITASHMRTEYTDGINSVHSEVVQTASNWNAKISGVVDSEGNVTAASIAIAINASTGESEAIIDAQKVYIGNQKSTTVINGKCSLSDVSADYIKGQIATLGRLFCSEMEGNMYGHNLLFASGLTPYGTTVYTNVKSLIKAVQIAGPTSNTYKLQYQTYNDDSETWHDAGSFSRATSLSGAWSGGHLEVTASPQNEHFHQYLEDSHVKQNYDGTEYTSGPIWYVPIYWKYDPNEQTSHETGQRIAVNTTNMLQSKTVTSNGVVYPDSGYLGLESVDVQVPAPSVVPVISYAWSSTGQLTVSTTPAAQADLVRRLGQDTSSISWNGNTATIPIVARFTVDSQERSEATNFSATVDATVRYNAGQNAVNIVKAYDNANSRVTFTKSAGTADTKAVKVGIKASGSGLGWSGNTYTYRICDYEDNQQGTNLETNARTVDASARYNAGVTDGKNAVSINKGSWSGGQIQFTKSEGTASTKGVKVGLGGSWSGNSYNYTIYDYYDNSQGVTTGYTGSIDASSIRTAGKNDVTLNDPSWNSVSSLSASRTVTVSTSGRPTQLSKSKTVHLTVGSWSSGSIPIYIRDGSTSGTIVAQNSVSMPAVSSTTWTNTTGRTWRADISIGGVTRSSSTKDFGGYYTDGYSQGKADEKAMIRCRWGYYNGVYYVNAYENDGASSPSITASTLEYELKIVDNNMTRNAQVAVHWRNGGVVGESYRLSLAGYWDTAYSSGHGQGVVDERNIIRCRWGYYNGIYYVNAYENDGASSPSISASTLEYELKIVDNNMTRNAQVAVHWRNGGVVGESYRLSLAGYWDTAYSSGHTQGMGDEKNRIRCRFGNYMGIYYVNAYENDGASNPSISASTLEYELNYVDGVMTRDAQVAIHWRGGGIVGESYRLSLAGYWDTAYSAARQHSGVLVYTGHSYNSSTGVHTYTYRQDINSANPIVGSGSRTVYW